LDKDDFLHFTIADTGWAKSARENLTDIAGVRVICSYIDDVCLNEVMTCFVS